MKWLPVGKSDDTVVGKTTQETFPLMKKQASCFVCNDLQTFTQVWRRAFIMKQCPNCGLVFEDPAEPYKRFQPACPKCEEPLEQPGFEYGYCDKCGSKYELMEGAKPGLLPNQRQREQMRKHGRSWSYL